MQLLFIIINIIISLFIIDIFLLLLLFKGPYPSERPSLGQLGLLGFLELLGLLGLSGLSELLGLLELLELVGLIVGLIVLLE